MQNQGDPDSRPASDLALFLHSLVNEGRAAVSPQSSSLDDADALPMLAEMDGFARAELALELPPFSPVAALWAARLLHQLCRFVVCRDIPAEQIAAACGVSCPEKRGPETDWSADLTLRHLPRVMQLARHFSNADPLVEQLKIIAVQWPLSSVGIAPLENLDLDPFIGHPALRRLYADRIIAAGDNSRLGGARMDDCLRADLGIHHDLAPAIAAKLFAPTHDTH